MPASNLPRNPGARRSQGPITPPSQRRRKQAAIEAAKSSGHPSSPTRRSTLPPARRSELARDRILGYGAAAGALMSLLGLTIAGIIVLVALGYVVAAFLASPDKRDRRLRNGGWSAGALAVFMALMVAAVLGNAGLHPSEDEVSLFNYLPLGGFTLILATASTLALALAAFFGGTAFGREGAERYRWLSRAALAVVFHFIVLLPAIVVSVDPPTSLGSFWTAPMQCGSFFFNVLAAAIVACAFFWASGTEVDATGAPATEDEAENGTFRFTFPDREYLLLAAAVALVLAQIFDLTTLNWSVLGNVGDETTSSIFTARASYIARALLPIVLAASAALAFWASCRLTGWTRRRWLDSTPSGLTRLLLTWRLPWFYGWLVVLTVACAFLGWYGLLAVAAAAAHYLVTALVARKPTT